MRQVLRIVVAGLAGVFALFSVSACGPPELETIRALPRPLSVGEQTLIRQNTAWSLGLLRQVVAEQGQARNVFLSPLSAGMALGMAANGARNATAKEMHAVLALDGLSPQAIRDAYRGLIDLLRGLDPLVRLKIANAIWKRRDFSVHQSFLDESQKSFDAKIGTVDFMDLQTEKTINAWASSATEGKIDAIVKAGDLTPHTVMMLVNAVYFKGAWRQRFDKKDTRPGPFTLTDGAKKNVPMMVLYDRAVVRSVIESDLKAIDLPYGGDAFRMTILLPTASSDISTLLASLDVARWKGLVARLDAQEPKKIGVRMPKFSLSQDYLLNDTLKAMGMERAFDPMAADFGGITREQVWISVVRHDTYVKVDEEGTEAAAATSVGFSRI
ncbi:MAG: serpin family protein, partial [Deltaproteobacteria bacterium]|nr:serpin family protein [Deltaproteobacteria bacterium]